VVEQLLHVGGLAFQKAATDCSELALDAQIHLPVVEEPLGARKILTQLEDVLARNYGAM
jgi:hypothetical protein